jgi:two-component system, sensor histidine kinase RegB
VDARSDALNLRWLTRLRWGAIAGQVAVIVLVDRAMAITLPLLPLALVIGVELCTNFACEVWLQRARDRPDAPEWVLGGIMALDVVLLTALLHFSGGSFNPFNFLYLVHIALAAVVLRARTTWALVALSLASFGSLFLPIAPTIGHLDHAAAMDIHLRGMWVAFAVAALFIAYFVGHIRRALEARDRELAAARERTQRSERLASLATLAAGAAHELSTPLATIQVAAKEIEAALARGKTDALAEDGLAEDARLIREQVARCRSILEHLSDDAGASRGEPPEAVAVDAFVRAAVALVRKKHPIEVEVAPSAEERSLHLPVRATAQALKGLIDNACDASAADGVVRVAVAAEAARCRITVRDEGSGMSGEVLERAGEPFYTTKEPGKGMGLGLFLARSVAEKLGGELELASRPGRGTTAALVLPLESRATSRRIAAAGAGHDAP